MNSLDKQLVSLLDRAHRRELGAKITPCRWTYQGATDTYQCAHMTIPGKDLISEYNQINGFTH